MMNSLTRAIAGLMFARVRAALTRLLRDAMPTKVPPSRLRSSFEATHHALGELALHNHG